MKKSLFAFLIVGLSLISCSGSDDDGDGDSFDTGAVLRMKVNGEQKTFTNIFSQKITGSEGTRLTLFLGSEFDPHETVVIRLFLNETGNNVIDEFYYNIGDDQSVPDFTNGSFTNNVSINNNTHFKAVFSGEVKNNNTSLQIQEGSLDVEYPVAED